MKIFLKTPTEKIDNKWTCFYAHLLEHLVVTNHTHSPKDYFIFNANTSSVNAQFTTHELADDAPLGYVQEVFQRPFSEELVLSELDILRKEDIYNLQGDPFHPDVVGKKLFGKNYLGMRNQAKLSYDVLNRLHAEYYDPKKRIVTDDDYNVIDSPALPMISDSPIASIDIIQTPCMYDSSKHYIFHRKCCTAVDYIRSELIFDLLQSYLLYLYRYQEHKAFEYPYLYKKMVLDEYYILVYRDEYQNVLHITEKYLEEYIAYYVEHLDTIMIRRIRVEAMTIFREQVGDDMLIQVIKNLKNITNWLAK